MSEVVEAYDELDEITLLVSNATGALDGVGPLSGRPEGAVLLWGTGDRRVAWWDGE